MNDRTTPGPAQGHRVLVVDDMADTRRMIVAALSREGYIVEEADTGESALALVAAHRPDLVLLDINMPGMGGLEVMAQLRSLHSVPVILLTGRDEENDRVLGLELGAEDYVVKPFYVRELAARTRSVLRRGEAAKTASAPISSATPSLLSFGSLAIRLAEREVLVGDAVVETTPKEFDLLVFFANSPRTVWTRQMILDHVWGSSTEWQDPATVTEHIRRLRKKIEPDPESPIWLHTVRGVGYRFDPPVMTESASAGK
ncbi:MAG TPA: response regulator transcription factor [Acidimicrobiales bacterium]|nr:response regulator transcription factor [Acidimicrobiales bacterium]